MTETTLLDALPPRERRVVQAAKAGVVDVKTFVEAFPIIVEAERGPKLLRDLVLNLAMRGRLTAARDTRNDGPFPIPASWRWVRLGELGTFLGGGTPSKSNLAFWNGKLPWVSPKDMKRPYIDDAEDHISEAALEASPVKVIRPGSLLFVTRGMILAHSFPVALATRPVTINQDMKALVLDEPQHGEFLLRACWEARRRVLDRVERSSHGTCRLDTEVVESLLLPLPPLAEQKRIVAKVDELMRLIDVLEEKHTHKRELRAGLRNASLHALASVNARAEFEHSCELMHTEFSELFQCPGDVRSVRDAIMALAARGCLVAPHANDGDATTLLSQLDAKREQLVAAGKAGRIDPSDAQEISAPPFPVRPNWCWVPFGRATICRDAQRIPVSKEERVGRRGPYDYYGASGVIDSIDSYIFDEPLLLFGEDGANLVNRATPIAFIARGKYWVNNHAHVIDGLSEDYLRYLALFIGATDLAPYVTGSAQPKLNQAKMNSIPIAIPPPGELLRIVAGVELLMRVCDKLELALGRVAELRDRLADAAALSMTC